MEFPIGQVLKVVGQQVARFGDPIVTQMSRKTRNPYKVLIATLLSLRTRDEQTAVASARLFEMATTPSEMARLPVDRIEDAIRSVGFFRVKAQVVIDVSRIIENDHGGRVPDTLEELLLLPGVGRKTANLVLIDGFGLPGMCVDTHVHRISNRWGYVCTKTPEQTEIELRRKLPSEFWMDYNALLVTFGQNICRPLSPHCSQCLVSHVCPRIGVERSR